MRLFLMGIVCCLLLSGVVHAEASLRELEVGMPRDEVISLLGEPQGRGSDGRREILFYGSNQEVQLEDGTVYMVTGADGVILERARATSGSAPREPRELGADVHHEAFESFFGEAFTFDMDTDAPDWAGIALVAFFVFIMVLSIAEMWCIFVKAGWPGWTCLVPIYNAYVMIKIAGKPGWWLLLMLVPIVNAVVVLILPFSLAARFGKGGGFGFGLLVLPILFYPILAFGSAEYQASQGAY